MASIGPGWADGAWVQASWIAGAWGAILGGGTRRMRQIKSLIKSRRRRK